MDWADEVRMWVFEETLASGEKLTDVINKKNVRVINLLNNVLFRDPPNHCSFPSSRELRNYIDFSRIKDSWYNKNDQLD